MQHGRLHHVRGEGRITLGYLYRQKQIVATAPLSINTVIGEVTGLLHSDAVIKNVAVELDLTEGLPSSRSFTTSVAGEFSCEGRKKAGVRDGLGKSRAGSGD